MTARVRPTSAPVHRAESLDDSWRVRDQLPSAAQRATATIQRKYGETLLERFWDQVAIGENGACSEWTGHKTPSGYGTFRVGRRKEVLAHRFSFELATTEMVPTGVFVCHHCDNPSCVWPDHLFLGTAKDNVADMMVKGRGGYRHGPGEKNGRAKLTEADVLTIRALPAALPHHVIAAQFGVSVSLTRMIRRREVWKHVGGDARIRPPRTHCKRGHPCGPGLCNECVRGKRARKRDGVL